MARAGHIYSRPDGALVRVDKVEDGKVYYVAWRPGQCTWRRVRMGEALFESEIIRNELALCDMQACPTCARLITTKELRRGHHTIDESSGMVVTCGRVRSITAR